jgi:hypothetical protein
MALSSLKGTTEEQRLLLQRKRISFPTGQAEKWVKGGIRESLSFPFRILASKPVRIYTQLFIVHYSVQAPSFLLKLELIH